MAILCWAAKNSLHGAGRILQLLTSSWSGWRALVQILVDVLPLRHVDPKWDPSSGRSAFMGGVSPLLYWLVVPARPVKISADVQNSCGHANFRYFLWKLKNSISASKRPITAPKIRTWSQLVSKFSYHTHWLLNGGRPRLWARLPRSGHKNPHGGVGEGWGRKWSAGKLPLSSHLDGGGGDRGWPFNRLHSTCMQSSFLFLFLLSPFCCRGLVRNKKACMKPHI